MTESTIEKDAQWLIDHGYKGLIAPITFSDWVTRTMGDGIGEAEARDKVIKLVQGNRE